LRLNEKYARNTRKVSVAFESLWRGKGAEMGQLFSSLVQYLFPNKEYKIVMVGLL